MIGDALLNHPLMPDRLVEIMALVLNFAPQRFGSGVRVLPDRHFDIIALVLKFATPRFGSSV